MTQPAWQRRARELLPEFLPPQRSATSLHDFLLDRIDDLQNGSLSGDLRDRIWTYAEYCLDDARADSVRADCMSGFVRHCVADPTLHGELIAKLASRATVILQQGPSLVPSGLWEAFRCTASASELWG